MNNINAIPKQYFEAHELPKIKEQESKPIETSLLGTLGEKITHLVNLPLGLIKGIYHVAMNCLRQVTDPWIFEMSLGGGCGGGYSAKDLADEGQRFWSGAHERIPLQGGTMVTIKTIASQDKDCTEINGISFCVADRAPTLVLCFGKDNTYATSPGNMLSLCKRMQALGMNLLLIDLPDHGFSKGKATEGSCIDALRSTYCYVKENWHVEDHHMFFLGQSLSSGMVGSIIEEHPDVNPIFVDPYANLSDLPSTYIPVFGILFNLLFKLLYKINTVNALTVLRGNACVIYAQNDALFGHSHMAQIMEIARKSLQTPFYIATNHVHGDKSWMKDQFAVAQFEAYLQATLTRSKERHAIQNIMQLEEYVSKYQSTLSIAERYALAKEAQMALIQHCKTPSDFTNALRTHYDPYNNLFYPCDLIYYCLKTTPLADQYGKELLEEFFEVKYKSALEHSDTTAAAAWIALVSTGRFSFYGKALKNSLYA